MHTINSHFVCFGCRLRVRHDKYDRQAAVVCPQCGGACAGVGDRCPIPPKNKEKAWQQLAQDYRQLQRAIAADYVQWKQKLLHIIDKHIICAEAMNLPDVLANDRLWQSAVQALPELPWAFERPFEFCLPQAPYAVAWSSIRQSDYRHLKELLARPANKHRQQLIDALLAEKNNLHIYDAYGELWLQHSNNFWTLRHRPRSELGDAPCFGYLCGYPLPFHLFGT